MLKSRVIIIGAGFGGLSVATHLAKSSNEITVIDKTNHHLFQPLLYQVASAALSPSDIARPIREILNKQKNTYVLMSEVIAIDKDNKTITTSSGDVLDFDFLVIAIGSRHCYFGKDAWEPFAPGIKTIDDALLIREKILRSFEKAEREKDPEEIEKLLNFVVVGGGPTGVELAGAIAEIAHKTMSKDFRRVNLQHTKIYLIEAANQILSTYPSSLSNKATASLRELGVDVITGKRVTDINADGITIEDQFIPTFNVLWAAGNQAMPLLKCLDTPLDKQGRVLVEADLSIPNHENIFVIGDAAAVFSGKKPIPSIAPAAIQEGKYVAKIISKGLSKCARVPFKYIDKGMMATIGKAKAIAMVGPIKLSGLVAWLAWSLIHVVYLIGFRNRFLVMFQWMHSYLTEKRSSRIITKPLETPWSSNPVPKSKN